MKKIVLVSCASKKRAVKSRAAELYISDLFKLSLQYARKLKPDAIFILSAKHGLLALDDEIEPYNVTLNKMRIDERKLWADRVIEQLQLHTDLQHDYFIVLAGESYCKYLLPRLKLYETPLKGLNIFKRVPYLKKQVDNE